MSDTDTAVLTLAIVCAIGTWGSCVLAISLKRIAGRWIYAQWSALWRQFAQAIR